MKKSLYVTDFLDKFEKRIKGIYIDFLFILALHVNFVLNSINGEEKILGVGIICGFAHLDAVFFFPLCDIFRLKISVICNDSQSYAIEPGIPSCTQNDCFAILVCR